MVKLRNHEREGGGCNCRGRRTGSPKCDRGTRLSTAFLPEETGAMVQSTAYREGSRQSREV